MTDNSHLALVHARRYNPINSRENLLEKPLTRAAIIQIIKNEMPILRQRFGVERIALFGSYAKNKASFQSDIDLVVSLTRPLGFSFIELADYLEEILGGKVDLITESTLQLGITDARRAHIAREIQESLIHV